MQGTATVSILDLVENKPKLMSIKLAEYDEGGNDKVPSIIIFLFPSVVVFCFFIPFPPSFFSLSFSCVFFSYPTFFYKPKIVSIKLQDHDEGSITIRPRLFSFVYLTLCYFPVFSISFHALFICET